MRLLLKIFTPNNIIIVFITIHYIRPFVGKMQNFKILITDV